MKEHYDNDLIRDIETQIKMKRYDLAKEKLDEYIQLYPNEKRIKSVVLRYYQKVGDYETALQYAQDNIKSSFGKKNMYALFLKEYAYVLNHFKRYDEAIQLLEDAINRMGGEITLLITTLGSIYSKNGEVQKAEQLFKKYENQHNKHDLNETLAMIYSLNGNCEAAIETAKKTDDIYLNEIQKKRKYYCLGKAYNMLFKKETDEFKKIELLEKAEASYRKALSKKDDYYYKSYYALAYLYYQVGRLLEAQTICEEIIKDNRGGENVNNLYCSICDELNNSERLIDTKTFKDPKEKVYSQSIICYEAKDFDKASYYLSHYLELNGKTHEIEAKHLLILCALKLGKYKDCLDLMYEYGDFDPKHEKEYSRIKYFCKYMLGEELNAISYTAEQINHYSEASALNHIKIKHLSKEFGVSISDWRFLKQIKGELTKDKLNPYYAFDVYELKFDDYEGLLYKYNVNLEKLIVVCIPNTKKILTMFPSKAEILMDELDIDDNDIKKKNNTRSRVDKFNQKYAKCMNQN